MGNEANGCSIGVVETQSFTFALPPHELVLESGEKLGPVTLAYGTYGNLNPDRSNAILILHALSDNAHASLATLTYLWVRARHSLSIEGKT